MKPKIIFLIKVFIAITPLVWIFTRTESQTLLEIAHHTSGYVLPLVAFLVLSTMFLQGFRWWILLRAFLPEIKLSTILDHHFTGIFYSLIMPTSAAQDFIRTLLISKHQPYEIAWGATWICRLLGLTALLCFTLLGIMIIDKSLLPKEFLVSFAIIFFVCFAVLCLSFSKLITRPLRKLFERFIPTKIIKIPSEIRESVYNFNQKKKAIFFSFLVTLLIQAIIILVAIMALKGITDSFYIKECLTFIPMVELITLTVPFTPNGMGLREAMLYLMFRQMGLSNEILGIFIAIGFFAITLKLFGGIPIFLRFIQKKKR